MGVKVFRDDNWKRITGGDISRRDIMDRDVLKAALHDPDHSVAAFAFCRLTGYSFIPDECDAYSYRTFSCGILPGMTAAYREAIWDCWISTLTSS